MRARMLAVPVALITLAASRPTVYRPSNDAPTRADASTDGPGTVNVVTVKAGDYFFEAPATIPAGMTTFRLMATGKELHHVTIFRLEGGHTISELMASMKESHGALPAWAIPLGGPNAPAPGGTFDATLDLVPGNYALLCFIPSPDGAPHMMKGMTKAITVTGPAKGSAPKADLTMRLADYSFDTDAPITAGRKVIRVENAASQPHEVEIVKLAPGKSAQEFLGWIEKMEGPPPGMPIGGVTFLHSGGVNFIEAEFSAGRYALLCFVPDAKDGKPHFMHGMAKEIEIK